MPGEFAEVRDLLANLVGIARKRNRLEHLLQPFALRLLHFFDFIGRWQVGGCQANQILGALQAILQAFGAVIEAVTHGVGAGSQPALVQ